LERGGGGWPNISVQIVGTTTNIQKPQIAQIVSGTTASEKRSQAEAHGLILDHSA
jgi:hypothetical protein